MKYEFIETHKAVYKITEICDCFDIKASGYYAWKGAKRGKGVMSLPLQFDINYIVSTLFIHASKSTN